MARLPLLAVVLLAVVGAGGGGCRSKPNPAIAVIPKATYGEYWKAVHAGAIKASREAGVPIVWKGPIKEDDRDDQIEIVETFTNMRVRGIVLAPLDDAALRAPVEDAVRGQIPVVVIDSALKSDAQASFVATDNRAGGRLAADHLARALGGRGNVALLRYQEGSASTTEREQGFLDGMAAHPGLRLVSANQFAGPTTESAVEASENLLASHGGGAALQGIFCPNESSTFGMLLALRQAGVAGKVRLVGFDSATKLVEALAQGDLDALVLQDPVGIGYQGVRAMIDLLQGRPPPRRIATDLVIATRATMREPRIRELLSPDVARWLGEAPSR